MSIAARRLETPPDRPPEDRDGGLSLTDALESQTAFDRELSAVQANVEEAGKELAKRQPVVASGTLLKALERTDALATEAQSLGFFSRGRKRKLLEQAQEMYKVVTGMQKNLENVLAEEAGTERTALVEKNVNFVQGIREQEPSIPLSPQARDQLRTLTVGLVGRQIKQAQFLNDDLASLQRTHGPHALGELHSNVNRAWERSRRISQTLPGAELSSLSNRLLMLRDAVAARLPNEPRYETGTR